MSYRELNAEYVSDFPLDARKANQDFLMRFHEVCEREGATARYVLRKIGLRDEDIESILSQHKMFTASVLFESAHELRVPINDLMRDAQQRITSPRKRGHYGW